MSKKMLKRSLALSALMAFVITGSAYAHVINEVGDYSTEGKGTGSLACGSLQHSVNVGGTLTIISPTDVGIQGYGNVTANKIIIDTLCTGIDGTKNDGDLNVSAKEIEITTEKYNGIQLNGGINKDININNFDKLNIIAGTQQEGHGISNNGSGEINISGKSVNIVAAENAVYTRMNDNGKVSINAYDVTIKSNGLGDDTNKGHAVIIRNKNADVSVTATNDVKISAISGKDAIRIDGSEGQVAGSSVNISAGNIVDINGQIYNRQGSLVDIDGKNITIDTNGEDAIVSSGGTVEIDAINDVKITSLVKDGIQTEGASVKLNAAKVEIKAGAWGVNATADGGSNVVINAEDIKIDGAEGGVRTFSKGGSVSLTAKQNIEIAGAVQGADGIKSKIDLKGNDVKITAKATTPSETEGAVRNVSIEATGKVTINAEGLCGVGAGPDKATMAQAMNSIKAKEINITSDSAFGVYANNHSYYAVGKRVHSYLEAETINIESKKDGIYASNGAVTEVKGFKTLNVTSTGEQGIGSKYGHLTFIGGDVVVTSKEEGIRSKLGGELKFDVDSLKVDAGLESIKLTGDSVLNIDANTVQLDGDITTETANGKNPILTAAFNDAESYLNGKVTTVDGAQTNLTFNKGATWNVTGASRVSTLNSNEGKFVFINDSHVDIDAGSGNINLTMADQTADNLNDAAGLTTVAEKLGVSEAAKETITAKVVMAEGDVKGETTGDVVFEDLGEDKYYHGEVKEVTEKVNTKNQAIGDAGVALKLHWRSHVNDMNKRMGELRNAEGEHGVWTRVVRGESEYKNTKAQYNQYQLGYDEKLSVDKRWTVGAAVTFAEGDANYGQGSTDDKSTAFAIYGSKLNNDGTFVDLIARYAHLESDLDDVNSGKGDYSTNGMSVSAEFGKRIQQGNGLWVEPQVELTYGTIDSAEFKLGQKTVQVGDMDSLIGRVGFRIGKDLEQGNVYARASYLYDFEGETENTFSKGNASRAIAEDLGGGWWEVGVGANINLSKATYIYADVEKTFGGEVDTNWQWNLGVRYSF